MYSRSTLFLAAAILAGGAATAGASDVYEGDLKGSIKDNAIEAILVPEAVEIPETMSWYLRGDFGYNFMATTDIETTAPGVVEPDPIESFGIGFGRYLSPNFRFDITADYRNDDEIYERVGAFQESIFRPGTVTVPDPADPTSTVDVQDVIEFRIDTTGTETVTFQNHAIMANLYYDLASYGGFRPYVGGGVGLSIYEIHNTRRVSYDGCEAFANAAALADPIGNPTGQLVNCDITQEDIDRASADRQTSKVAFGYAFSATAGASYDISESTKIDMNYRVTYSAANAVALVGGIGESIDVQSKVDQEFRIGVRYDLW